MVAVADPMIHGRVPPVQVVRVVEGMVVQMQVGVHPEGMEQMDVEVEVVLDLPMAALGVPEATAAMES